MWFYYGKIKKSALWWTKSGFSGHFWFWVNFFRVFQLQKAFYPIFCKELGVRVLKRAQVRDFPVLLSIGFIIEKFVFCIHFCSTSKVILKASTCFFFKLSIFSLSIVFCQRVNPTLNVWFYYGKIKKKSSWWRKSWFSGHFWFWSKFFKVFQLQRAVYPIFLKNLVFEYWKGENFRVSRFFWV